MLRALISAVSAIFLSTVPLAAQTIVAPSGSVILTVTGNVAVKNTDAAALLDLEMLEAVGTTTIETATIWTEGTQVFEGVSLAALVRALGLTGTTLRATAINDYAVEVPMTDAVEGGPIIAYRLDGQTMSVRDKGPLWIIYPYDQDEKYRTEVIYSRSIWQLDHIEALD
jgi:hypothetical protein